MHEKSGKKYSVSSTKFHRVMRAAEEKKGFFMHVLGPCISCMNLHDVNKLVEYWSRLTGEEYREKLKMFSNSSSERAEKTSIYTVL